MYKRSLFEHFVKHAQFLPCISLGLFMLPYHYLYFLLYLLLFENQFRDLTFLVPPIGFHPLNQHSYLLIFDMVLLSQISVRISFILEHFIFRFHIHAVRVLFLSDFLDLALHEL